MADPTHGAAGAVASALQDAKAELPEPAEQLDLLAAEHRPTGQRLWRPEEVAAEVDRMRKAGRPKGAQNLVTRELREWIVRLLGGTPQEKMARWAAMEPEEIARRLGCTTHEAFQHLKDLWRELAPYIMAKVVPVDDQGRPVPLVALAIGGQVAGSDGRAPWEAWFDQSRAQAVDVTPEDRSE